MTNIYYSPAYVGSGFAFDTTRKSGWIADSLVASPMAGIDLVEPQPLTSSEVGCVHDPDYVRAVETGDPRRLAQSQGFGWDAGVWPMVLASNGGVVAAALSALEHGVAGSLSSGLHHARRASGSGFCTFNGLAIAARRALDAGAESVLILDVDAHCGGGTAALIADEPRITQIDVSVSSVDRYPSSAKARLQVVDEASDYLRTISEMLEQLDRDGQRFDLCLYNAGMDPFEDCGIGGLAGINEAMLAERERLVFDWCRARRMPIAFVLAGGYTGGTVDEGRLVALHRLTLSRATVAAQGIDSVTSH